MARNGRKKSTSTEWTLEDGSKVIISGQRSGNNVYESPIDWRQRFPAGSYGTKYDHRRGWYEVDLDEATYHNQVVSVREIED